MKFKEFCQLITEMPHVSFKGDVVDFYAEKDPKWVLHKFASFAEKYQNDPDFIKDLQSNIFLQLAARKSYTQLNPQEKESFHKRLNKNVRELILGKTFKESCLMNLQLYIKEYIKL